ncbi:hypothetical protein PoB_004508100 [Plakobranchus ocellatus]|uniref:Uncharacterized protein n=1 Tax=Plakobranchus ocellatus TaxID=259542 RepID=A0AAV4BDS9_9GAST|nr:hypothetical protein PoB_004508100 [Plakobranchus ocellatus]
MSCSCRLSIVYCQTTADDLSGSPPADCFDWSTIKPSMAEYGRSDFSYRCPSSLYDCHSLESALLSTADVFLKPEFMASYHDDSFVGEICRFAS